MLLCFQPVLSPKHNLRGNRSTNPSTATVRQEGADGEHFMKPKYFLPEENMAFLSTLSFYGPHRNQFSHSFDIICVLWGWGGNAVTEENRSNNPQMDPVLSLGDWQPAKVYVTNNQYVQYESPSDRKSDVSPWCQFVQHFFYWWKSKWNKNHFPNGLCYPKPLFAPNHWILLKSNQLPNIKDRTKYLPFRHLASSTFTIWIRDFFLLKPLDKRYLLNGNLN